MATGAAKWIWENSRASNGSLIVLLAIADEIGEGEFTEMKIAGIAAKARLSDKGARLAIKDLASLAELSVTPRQGGVSRYELTLTPVKTTGVPRSKVPDHPGKNYRAAETTGRSKLPDPPEEPQVNGTPVKTTGPRISDKRSTTGLPVVEKPSSAPRPDVDRLCAHLADRIVANGSKRPNITRRWKDAARLLIDNDGRTEDQAHKAIDWCQDDEFWRTNILSMPKLREKYDQLRLKASQRKAPARQTPDDDYAAALQRIQARKENGNGTGGNGHDSPARQIGLPAAANGRDQLRNLASRHRRTGFRRRPGRRDRHRPLGAVLRGSRHHRRSRARHTPACAPVGAHRPPGHRGIDDARPGHRPVDTAQRGLPAGEASHAHRHGSPRRRSHGRPARAPARRRCRPARRVRRQVPVVRCAARQPVPQHGARRAQERAAPGPRGASAGTGGMTCSPAAASAAAPPATTPPSAPKPSRQPTGTNTPRESKPTGSDSRTG